MFASLNLLMPMPAAATDTGGDLHADTDSGFTAILDAQLGYSERLEMPEAIPVSTDLVGGDLLPAGGKNLPLSGTLAMAPAQQDPANASPAVTADEPMTTDLELELNVEYPLTEQPAQSVPPLALLPQEATSGAKQIATTPVQSSGDSATEVLLQDEKPLPPVEQLRPARQWLENTDWVAPKAEAGPVIPSAMQSLRLKADRPVVQVPTPAVAIVDGDTVPENVVPLAPPVRTTAALDTLRQADLRISGSKTPAAPTPTHIAATFSQLSGTATMPRDDTLTTLIATPVRDNAWGEKLGERVLLLADGQVKTADIRLTPADLGPLRIQLSIDDGAANVTFHAQHAVTREAIEQALPRLREMLAESGLSLGQASVSDRGASGDHAQNNGSSAPGTRVNGDDSGEALLDHDAPVRRKTVSIDGLVDTFA